jgi:hypothetical protein
MRDNYYYILEGHTPKAVSFEEWSTKFSEQDRRVALSNIGESEVSTVFLGLDHGWGGETLLFETLVFGGPMDGEMNRCETWEQAEEMHKTMCEMVSAQSQ